MDLTKLFNKRLYKENYLYENNYMKKILANMFKKFNTNFLYYIYIMSDNTCWINIIFPHYILKNIIFTRKIHIKNFNIMGNQYRPRINPTSFNGYNIHKKKNFYYKMKQLKENDDYLFIKKYKNNNLIQSKCLHKHSKRCPYNTWYYNEKYINFKDILYDNHSKYANRKNNNINYVSYGYKDKIKSLKHKDVFFRFKYNYISDYIHINKIKICNFNRKCLNNYHFISLFI